MVQGSSRDPGGEAAFFWSVRDLWLALCVVIDSPADCVCVTSFALQQQEMAAPPLTADQAKDALKKILQTFIDPANKGPLEAALAEVAALPADQQAMAKMAKLVPLVTGMCQPIMTEFNQPNIMMGVMQIQMQAQANPAIGEGCALLMKAVSGNVPPDAEVHEVIGKL